MTCDVLDGLPGVFLPCAEGPPDPNKGKWLEDAFMQNKFTISICTPFRGPGPRRARKRRPSQDQRKSCGVQKNFKESILIPRHASALLQSIISQLAYFIWSYHK